MIVEVVKPENELYNKFNTLLKQGNVIVLYYANWCGHCQMMKPEWDAFKSKCKTDPKYKHLKVAEVESEFIDNTKGADQVQGFPTIKFYKQNKTGADVAPDVVDFQEDRKVDNFLNFTDSNTVKEVEVVEKKIANTNANNANSRGKKTKGRKGKKVKGRKTGKSTKTDNKKDEKKVDNMNNSVKTKKAKLPKRKRTKKETNALRDLVFGKK